MATREFAAHAAHAHAAPQGFVRKWVFSLDHKVIGLQYLFPGADGGVRRHVSLAADAHPLDLAHGFVAVARRYQARRPT